MKPLPLVLVSLLFLQEASAMAQTTPSLTADQTSLAQGNSAFAVDLYNQLRKQDGNLFFSPASISTALAMAYAGARGTTAGEMAKTLHFTLPADKLHPAMGALIAGLNAQHKGYQLRVANALWAQQNEKFLAGFLTLTKAGYGAGFRPVDFEKDPEKVRLVINQWIEQQTEDKIKDMLQPGSVTADTRLVLTNAIYFKGAWQDQFKESQTRDEDFHLSTAQSVKSPMMHQSHGYRYFDGGTFQALEIPYQSGDLSMVVLLPNDLGGLGALEQKLTPGSVEGWLAKMQYQKKVNLALPRFTMTHQFVLNDPLMAMGMRSAFVLKDADFSGMTGDRRSEE